jgi:guanylate kinase
MKKREIESIKSEEQIFFVNSFVNGEIKTEEYNKDLYYFGVNRKQQVFRNTDKVDTLVMHQLRNLLHRLNAKLVLTAPACAGKDHLTERLIELGFKKEISYTTRPPREGETNGKDYHFISEDEMDVLMKNGEIIQVSKFVNNFRYATSVKGFEECDFMILTPKGINKFSPEIRNRMLVMYIDIPEDIRRERYSKRVNASPMEDRILEDRETFIDYANWDVKITNPNF